MRLTFRAADRTLTDAEVQTAVDGIVAALARAHDATLRA
jgi:phenylalanyl-tRNA synthetase beta subunit